MRYGTLCAFLNHFAFRRSNLQQRDLSLNLSSSQSENALKQLKTLTSPLSKLAKGMQTFGMNLDPRKITVKVSRFFQFCSSLKSC